MAEKKDHVLRVAHAIQRMELNPGAAKKFLGEKLGVNEKDVNMGAEATLELVDALAEKFPDHRRSVVITFKPDEGFSFNAVGRWQRTELNKAAQAFEVFINDYFIARRVGRSDVKFATMPTPEEVREERRKRAQRVLEREIMEGLRDDYGNVIPEAFERQHIRRVGTVEEMSDDDIMEAETNLKAETSEKRVKVGLGDNLPVEGPLTYTEGPLRSLPDPEGPLRPRKPGEELPEMANTVRGDE